MAFLAIYSSQHFSTEILRQIDFSTKKEKIFRNISSAIQSKTN